jgi:hypothetical protein
MIEPKGRCDVLKWGMLAAALAMGGNAGAQQRETVDLDMVSRIRQEAFHRSQVMDTFSYLTERIGPRLTNSPAMGRANAWTRGKFNEWKLDNVHDEAFDDFGRGWEFTSASVEMLGDRVQPLHALPKAWTPGTKGPVEGELVQVEIKKPEDIEKYRGKLRGKILLLGEAREYSAAPRRIRIATTPPRWKACRSSPCPRTRTPPPSVPSGSRSTRNASSWRPRSMRSSSKKARWPRSASAAGTTASSALPVAGSRKAGESVGIPELAMISEHFNPLVRALEAKQTVRLRVDVAARFTDEADQPGYNTLAEIRGSSKPDEVVMIGAHLDSWHSGTGAADNAAGVAVMMEAMRILKATGAKPRRTIRVALWSGEEQGLIGSQAYVAKHFGRFPEPTDPAQKALPASLREPTGALQKTRDYGKFQVYFNMDNGSGRFRGIYAQENLAAMPIFEAWLAPFHDVGATTVATRNTGSTDHISFDRIGLPGFQFIQDRLDYFTNVHHSHLDTWDHAEPEDLKQAAAIVASFAYNAAMREQPFPRKVEP